MTHLDQINLQLQPSVLALLIAEGRADPSDITRFSDWLKATPPDQIASEFSGNLRDEVTGLWNPKGMRTLYDNERQSMDKDAEPFDGHSTLKRSIAATVLDIEGMGYANSSSKVGYEAVNRCLLKPLGAALLYAARSTDTVGRIGGDEFAVTGQSRFYSVRDLPHVATRFAVNGLAGLLADPNFTEGFGLDSVGVLAKSGQIDAKTEWDDVLKHVDPKQGMNKGTYDYTQLPEGTRLHRIYKNESGRMLNGIGYLSVNNSGGWFVPCSTIAELGETLGAIGNGVEITDMDTYYELTASEVARPYEV